MTFASSLGLVEPSDSLRAGLRDWAERDESPVLFTGDESADKYVRPIPGCLVVLGAEQGSGKSTLALQWILGRSRRGPALYISAEDSSKVVNGRLASMIGGVDLVGYLYGEAPSDPQQIYMGEQAAHEIAQRELAIAHTSQADEVARLLMACPAGTLVAVDYLQALQGVESQDRRNEIRSLLASLTRIARGRELCLIAISQLVRPSNREIGTEPNRHWVKEASDIADAADRIVMVHRDQSGESDNAPTHVKLDKCKDGFSGKRWRYYKHPRRGALIPEVE